MLLEEEKTETANHAKAQRRKGNKILEKAVNNLEDSSKHPESSFI